MQQIQKYCDHEIPNWVKQTAPWYYREEIIHKVGKILTALGVLLAIGTVAGASVLSGHTVVIGVSGGAASLTLLFLGIYQVRKKEFWNDPAYKLKIRNDIIETTFNRGYSYIPKVDLQHCRNYDLVSNSIFKEIVLEHHYKQSEPGIFSHLHGYGLQNNRIADLIRDGIFEPHYKKTLFLELINSEDIQTAIQLRDSLSLYAGWSVLYNLCDDEVITAETKIKNNGQTLRDFLEADVASDTDFSDIYKKFESLGVRTLLKFNLVSPEIVRDKFLALYDPQATCFSDIFSEDEPYVDELWELLLDRGIVQNDEFRTLIQQECGRKDGFKKVLGWFKWKPFELDAALVDDKNVYGGFLDYLKNISLPSFCEHHYTQAEKCGFFKLNSDLLNHFDLLRRAYFGIKAYYSGDRSRLSQLFVRSVEHQLAARGELVGRNLATTMYEILNIAWKKQDRQHTNLYLQQLKSQGFLREDFSQTSKV